MRTVLNQYEAEIRLGLLVIVVLLLLLNFGTIYIFYNGMQQVSEGLDKDILSALQNSTMFLQKNQISKIPEDQVHIIRQRYNVEFIAASSFTTHNEPEILQSINAIAYKESLFSELSQKQVNRLLEGDKLLLGGTKPGDRTGIQITRVIPGQYLCITAKAYSQVLAFFLNASKIVLYMAIGIVILIIPLTIGLPRIILKPFKKMKETAENAGQEINADAGDEVAQIIESYEGNIRALRRKEEELTRLYSESTSKARQLEKLNKYIMQSIPSGVIHIDLDGKVIEYNRAAGEILGYDSDLVMGKHYLTAFPEDDEIIRLIDAGLIRGETISHREVEFTKDNQQQYLGVVSARIYDDSGSDIGVALLFTNDTEVKQLQSEIETNRRLATLGEMTGGLAHQLRNSLAAISGFSQLLVKKADSDSFLGDIALSIYDETKTSGEMVRRFLNFAKPLSLTQETLDLNELVRECIAKVSGIANGNSIEIMGPEECPEIIITGDSLLLKEAIGNIIDNAFQAIESNGRIEIAVSEYESRAHIIICDNGTGIDESIKNDIFTPFVSSRPSGTGLGLALTHKIITLHGGNISYNNRVEGGTIFRVALPSLEKNNYHGPTAAITAKNM
ncbi:MAG: PAS domain-containing protein [candidate division Zixibacteria bacterium]|nr:PAS domain-containing protein [candidate division Zixibacteria bacterium]